MNIAIAIDGDNGHALPIYCVGSPK